MFSFNRIIIYQFKILFKTEANTLFHTGNQTETKFSKWTKTFNFLLIFSFTIILIDKQNVQSMQMYSLKKHMKSNKTLLQCLYCRIKEQMKVLVILLLRFSLEHTTQHGIFHHVVFRYKSVFIKIDSLDFMCIIKIIIEWITFLKKVI
jgi:hypothetical protein